MIKKTDIIIILPAYNEEKYLASVLQALNKNKWRYIVVDDGSDDNSHKIASKFTSHILRHKVNLGKGASLRTGCVYAFNQLKAKAVIFMDSDGQHSIKDLNQFLKMLQSGYKIVLGVRSFDSTMPLIKIISNRSASVLIMLLFGKYIPDIPSGYKAVTKSVYNKLKLKSSNYDIELEIAVKIAKFRLKYAVVPIKTIYHDKEKGFQFLDAIKMIFNLISWRIQLL